MEIVIHLLGICPDTHTHFDLIDYLVTIHQTHANSYFGLIVFKIQSLFKK